MIAILKQFQKRKTEKVGMKSKFLWLHNEDEYISTYRRPSTCKADLITITLLELL